MESTGNRRVTVRQPETPAPAAARELRFGPFRLLPDGRLFRQSDEIRLPPKDLLLLRLLASNAGWIISAEHLRKSLWGDVYVSPDSLPRCVSSLRANLGEPDCIQTVYKRGYRFILPLQLSPNQPSPTLRLDRPTPAEAEQLHPRELPRLAILPLSGGDGVPHALGAEIAESALLRLARMRSRPVALLARDSVFSLAASGATAHRVGIELNAHLALTGRITRLPTHLRIRIEVIRIDDAIQLWVEDFLVRQNAEADVEIDAAKRIAAFVRSRCAFYPIPETPATPIVAHFPNPVLLRA